MSSYFGKYRGKVEANIDPQNLARLQVSCPAVLGEGTQSWAMPCVPYAGEGVGFFFLPPVGANVWVEFEGGNTDYPIWSGCFWATGEVPASPATPENKMLVTDSISLKLNHTQGEGGFTLTVDSPIVDKTLSITCDQDGITITNSVATVALTAQDLQLSIDPAKITLSSSSIELSQDPAKVTIEPSSIGFELSPSEVKIEPSGIALSSAPAKISAGSSGIELKNGAASVALSPASVSINNGALEVI